MFPNKFVILWDNAPVGLDYASGGYPYKCDSPAGTKFWNTRKEAEDYVDKFDERFRIVEVKFVIVS